MSSRYHLEKLIARGGMAEVHLARARGAGGFTKLLALKRILETYAGNPQLTAMFMDEANLAARLSHPNIVQVFDFGRDDDGYFIAMEYVPGPDLAAVLRVLREQGVRLAEAPAIDLLIQTLRGLDHAHRLTGPDGAALGVIHRDVSPGNVLLTTEGVAKLSDFGVARTTERLAEGTRAGKTKGKSPYMSPEQARSGPIDARSDLFSAGLVLWEALAGERCYQSSDDAAVIRMAALGQVRSLKGAGVEISHVLEAVLDRALQVDPAARFSSAAEMAAELEAYHRATYPRYTSSALGEVVQRVIAALPPLPHVGLPALAPDDAPTTQVEAAAPEPVSPDEPATAPSIRRPRAVTDDKPRPPAQVTPRVPAPDPAPDPLKPAAPARASASVLKLALVTGAVAAAVAGGLTVISGARQSAMPPPIVPRDSPMRPVRPPAPQAPAPTAPTAPAKPAPPPVEVRSAVHGAHPSAHGTGYLSVKCQPWCDIQIDGKASRQRSPAVRIPLSAGTHHLRLVNPQLNLSKKATVVIHANEAVLRYFNLVLDQ